MSLRSRYEQLGETIVLDQTTRHALRVNTLKISEQELVRILEQKGVVLEKIPFAPGYWYESEFSLGATHEYLQGYYYLQEAASQLPPLVLDPKSGEVVLDMAAAPGSKTTQMAQMMCDQGVIIALDSDSYRLSSLRNNTERLGVTCVASYKKDARFANDLGLTFDKVLLDAPCSGNYCIEQNFFSIKTVEGFRTCARLQKELLKSAYRVLRPGGVLVYSTCSLEPEEDELVLDWLLSKYEDLELQPTNLFIGDPAYTEVFGKKLHPSISRARRLWPHKTGTQGFFIAKVGKRG